MEQPIIIKNAHQNNLKNIDLEIPRNKLVVLTVNELFTGQFLKKIFT